ncbi:rhodanese-like domain-containing protein [Aestuariivirga litoralis]|uniref:rhodanese-like domain-containing protein n=1 Tax=Aestuariivirga litoralis TaxID=2650924 RepID=UPI0018C5B807|nr:rhodanese-like domain-containing protein [Aestuariivirga litoralis]MBG1232064.1 rhodanese-like domain-containing protein [Aestuariivirga litoralis]
MVKKFADMLAAARAVVPTISVEDAKKLLGRDDVVFLDVRDGTELQATGKVKGAIHTQRGLLEGKADPDSPGHVKELTPEKTLITYCASGGRAALAGQTLKEMGYDKVFNLGKFQDWKDGGGETEA